MGAFPRENGRQVLKLTTQFHLPTNLKNELSSISSLQYVSMAWWLIIQIQGKCLYLIFSRNQIKAVTSSTTLKFVPYKLHFGTSICTNPYCMWSISQVSLIRHQHAIQFTPHLTCCQSFQNEASLKHPVKEGEYLRCTSIFFHGLSFLS